VSITIFRVNVVKIIFIERDPFAARGTVAAYRNSFCFAFGINVLDDILVNQESIDFSSAFVYF